MPAFDIQGARKAGYSDAEIAETLAGKSSFNLQAARQAGYTDAEIAEKLSGYEPVGVAEDVARSALSAIPKAAVATPMWLADVGNLAAQGASRLMGHAYDAVSEKNLTPEQWDYIKSRKPFFGSQDVIAMGEKATGVDLYDPQTKAGKLTDSAIQFAAGNKAAGGGAMAGAIAGGASEAAGQATEGTAFEAPARIGTALIAGTAAERGNLFRTNAGTQANLAVKDLTSQQMEAATKLMDDAASVGMKLTPAEAIAQVTGNKGQPLLSLQRSVETSPRTSARMGEFMADRPTQNQAVMDDFLQHGIGEPVNYPAIPSQTQKTAEQSIKGVEQQRTMAASPYYDAAKSVKADSAALQGLVNQIDAVAKNAPASVRNQLSALKSDIAASDGTIQGLDTVRKLFRDRLDTPEIGANAVEKTTAAQVSPFLDELNKILESASPDFVQGKSVYQAMTPQVELANASPVGKLARSNPDSQNAIMSQFDDLVRSDSARPQDVADAVKKLAAVNPEAPQNLIAAGLRLEWEKATKGLISGENQFGGAKFASNVGTEKVRAAINALPGGANAIKGFDLLMDAYGAQGKRLPVGSPTAEKGVLQSSIEKGGVIGAVSRPIKSTQDAIADFRSSKANEQLLEVLTAPDGVAKLQELAKVGANNPRGQAIIRTLIMGGKANEMSEPEDTPAPPEPSQQPRPDIPKPVTLTPMSKTPTRTDMLVSSLEKAEGNEERGYKDTLGNRTIGIGFNMDTPNAKQVWKQAGIETPFEAAYGGQKQLSQDEIRRLALVSQLNAEKDVKQLVPQYDNLSPNRKEALLHMSYQLGKPRLKEFSDTLRFVNQGDYSRAAASLLDSKYAQQTPNRVRVLAEMLANDVPYGG